MKNLIIGNWKLNNTIQESNTFFSEFVNLYEKYKEKISCDFGVAPTFTTIASQNVWKNKIPNLNIVAQNVNENKSGAFTGEISIPMLKELNVNYIIIGHSERRAIFKETDETINKKLLSILENNLKPILCVGESLTDFEAGKTQDVVLSQLDNALIGVDKKLASKIVIAYEPVWAIGTGKTATPEIAQNICKLIRDHLSKRFDEVIAKNIIIQYGGSVNPENIGNILSQNDINGALVGGASLKPKSFIELLIS